MICPAVLNPDSKRDLPVRLVHMWRKMLGLFRKHNKIPRNELLSEFLDSAKASHSPPQAIEVVRLARAFSLPVCEGLAQRVLADFVLSPEQKEALGPPTALAGDSDSDISEGT
ncbi:small ribosomal subunit protein mS39-like [Saccopteryx bilineata]|uniref:small ribosomal subunit protein mS39-like n=1 Tax=Saccopteryx bilineata TaxID=59482 RepID=UPI00338DA283